MLIKPLSAFLLFGVSCSSLAQAAEFYLLARLFSGGTHVGTQGEQGRVYLLSFYERMSLCSWSFLM